MRKVGGVSVVRGEGGGGGQQRFVVSKDGDLKSAEVCSQ